MECGGHAAAASRSGRPRRPPLARHGRATRSGGMAAALRHGSCSPLHLMQTQTNVSNPERWVSVIAGAAIAAFGLKRRSLGGLALAGIGGGLLWRGATGHCAIYESLGLSTNGHEESQVS